jgi:hypothetical protein
MPHNNRFICNCCSYRAISCLSPESTNEYSVKPMICASCKTLSNYFDKKLDENGYLQSYTLVCNTCSKSNYLIDWKKYSCPKCGFKMRAYGKSFFWQNPSESHSYFFNKKRKDQPCHLLNIVS